jgi:hypothetical protein
MTKAISASTRGWMNRPAGIAALFANSMSSSSTPLSGVVMLSACCMARLVRPIFQPMTPAPAARFFATRAACTA